MRNPGGILTLFIESWRHSNPIFLVLKGQKLENFWCIFAVLCLPCLWYCEYAEYACILQTNLPKIYVFIYIYIHVRIYLYTYIFINTYNIYIYRYTFKQTYISCILSDFVFGFPLQATQLRTAHRKHLDLQRYASSPRRGSVRNITWDKMSVGDTNTLPNVGHLECSGYGSWVHCIGDGWNIQDNMEQLCAHDLWPSPSGPELRQGPQRKGRPW